MEQGPLFGCVTMLKLQVRRWSERPRMLLFMLAVMLPAAALILTSAWHLRSIQREKAVEAVIQRDYQHVLKIAEKRIDERAYRMSEEARDNFPGVDHPEELETFLTTHPNISHAFLWTGKGSLEFQSQPGQMSDPEFREQSKTFSADIGDWFDRESKGYIAKLMKMEA